MAVKYHKCQGRHNYDIGLEAKALQVHMSLECLLSFFRRDIYG